MFCTFVLQADFSSYAGGNHLSTGDGAPVPPSVHFLPEGSSTIIWVSRSRGLPRSTSAVSSGTASLWHFQGYDAISCDLGASPAVSPAEAGLPWLMNSPGANTTVIADRASMDFPLHSLSECSDYPNANNALQPLIITSSNRPFNIQL